MLGPLKHCLLSHCIARHAQLTPRTLNQGLPRSNKAGSPLSRYVRKQQTATRAKVAAAPPGQQLKATKPGTKNAPPLPICQSRTILHITRSHHGVRQGTHEEHTPRASLLAHSRSQLGAIVRSLHDQKNAEARLDPCTRLADMVQQFDFRLKAPRF